MIENSYARRVWKILRSIGIITTLILLLGAFVLGLFVIGGFIGLISFIFGLGFLAILTMLLGNSLGLRSLVFGLATTGYDRFILLETHARYELCPVREHTDTKRYDYEYYHEDEWHGFEDSPDRWHNYNGIELGLLWEKNKDVLEGSKNSENWVKETEYVIDGSKELGVLREAGEPGVIQRVRELVLKRETADEGTSVPMQFLITIGGIVIGVTAGFVLVLVTG